MDKLEIHFTQEDRAILASYRQMLDGLAQYLGSGYELVLHSLEDLEHSAIRVINGDHTGRREGAPITELALAMLGRIRDEDGGDCICYNSTNKNGAPLRSTTIAIRGGAGRIIGLLCINFYLDTPLSTLLRSFGPDAAPPETAEVYVQNTGEMISSAIARACARVDADGFANSPLRNREIVARLYEAGIFSVKEAVALVADALGLSRNTVYLHLRHCRGE